LVRYWKFIGVVLVVAALVGVLVGVVIVGPDLLEIRATQAACDKYFSMVGSPEIYTISEFRGELKELVTSEKANPVVQEALMQLLAEVTQYSGRRYSASRQVSLLKMARACNNLQSVQNYFFGGWP